MWVWGAVPSNPLKWGISDWGELSKETRKRDDDDDNDYYYYIFFFNSRP